jgi:NAD+ diphosphatase
MLGFTARVIGDPTLRLDDDEIEEARWFSREELRSGQGPRALPPPVSIARNIIDRWVDGELS